MHLTKTTKPEHCGQGTLDLPEPKMNRVPRIAMTFLNTFNTGTISGDSTSDIDKRRRGRNGLQATDMSCFIRIDAEASVKSSLCRAV